MPRYAITERAGPFVAAHRNTGVGTILELTEHQAEHELRLGTLVALPVAAAAEPSDDATPVSAPEAAEDDFASAAQVPEAGSLPPRKTKRHTA